MYQKLGKLIGLGFGRVFWVVESYPCIHEDKVHLAECEDHLEDRVDAPQDLVAGGVPRDLEEGSKFESVVDHCAKTEA